MADAHTASPSNPEDEFFNDLKAFHEDRGTPLRTDEKVNGRPIDLYKLYNIVREKGGYDIVSSEKLAWRKVGQEFNLGQTNTAAYAFALKTVFYKNLAAYAIKRLHNQEPPPKEILEDISAKGGDLLSRTMENFKPPQSREHVANGNDSELSGDEEHRTPKEEKMDVDDPGSGGGRATRGAGSSYFVKQARLIQLGSILGLRQAPPQRQLFQPDVSSSRQSRHAANNTQSPQPYAPSATNTGHVYGFSSNPNSSSFSINSYEPRPPIPMTLRPLPTPGSNPIAFAERVKRLVASREARAANAGQGSLPSKPGIMLPGSKSSVVQSPKIEILKPWFSAGFEGPNIYVRTLLALRCGIPEEVDFALHHLVKISHERGDKFKFEAFAGLAEGLIEKALEVGSLFYDVKWEISYSDDDESSRDLNVLDGMLGTRDLLERIRGLTPIHPPDDVELLEFTTKLIKINEAGLILRNMALLEENAKYLSEICPVRDLLTIVLNLPSRPMLIELKLNILEIAEQLTKYWSLDSTDPLYVSLLDQLSIGVDRGTSLITLRTISRIALNLEVSNRLEGVPRSVIERLCAWTLLDDEELVSACLDFFYQFTAVPENVAFLLTHAADGTVPLHALIIQLGRLLLHDAQETFSKRLITPAIPAKIATEVPNMPADILEQITQSSEPERSALWLKVCFEEDEESEITQIAIWQAYQARFNRLSSAQNPALAAAEFIKNVSTTFPRANAQVINGPPPKFIIKGIKPRHIPVDAKGRAYLRCYWKDSKSPKSCGEFFLTPDEMFTHMAATHLGLPRTEDGKWNLMTAKTAAALEGHRFNCHWSGCQHFAATNGSDSPLTVGLHIKQHLPDTSPKALLRAKANKSGSADEAFQPNHSSDPDFPSYLEIHGKPAEYDYMSWFNTAVDERGDPVGLPLTSVLVLKNLARNIPRAVGLLEGPVSELAKSEGPRGWMERMLGPVKPQLAYVFAHNRSLGTYVADLMFLIEKGIAET
ncbi:Chromatin structure-remodeling complex protein rsc9 [Trapelia coarctata]|nr:Chromatin structure-remodeling complex protein rsc9 [Trapelia coarctata]